VTAVLASLVLAAVLACPCPAMATGDHGCCADEGSRIGPSDCCRPAVSLGEWTARPAVSASASFALVFVVPLATAPTPLPQATPAVSLPASPPRVLRI
jgi:hypothetical protein